LLNNTCTVTVAYIKITRQLNP